MTSNVQKNVQTSGTQIPADLDLFYVYNPRFHLIDLISTRRNPFCSTRSPPRPPNSFFLMKNCYMLELRLLGHRLAMPELCRQAKLIWKNIPQDVKDRYDNLALQAQILHQEIYPGYKFSPKKRTTFKPYIPINDGMNTFTVSRITTGLNPTKGSINHPTPITPKNDIYLVESQESASIQLESENNNIDSLFFPELDYFRDPFDIHSIYPNLNFGN